MNCWINKAGKVYEIPKYRHAVEQRREDCIRVSLPEGRRTWVGIVNVEEVSEAAAASLLRIVRQLHADGLAIRADLNGAIVEVQPHERPTCLNRAIREAVEVQLV